MKTKIMALLSLIIVVIMSTTGMAYYIPYEQVYRTTGILTCLGSTCNGSSNYRGSYANYNACVAQAKEELYSYESRKLFSYKERMQQYGASIKECYQARKEQRTTQTNAMEERNLRQQYFSYRECLIEENKKEYETNNVMNSWLSNSYSRNRRATATCQAIFSN